MDPVQTAYQMFVGLLRMQKSPEQATAEMLNVGMPADVVATAGRRYEEIAKEVVTLRVPAGLRAASVLEAPWYTGARPGDDFWPALEGQLRDEEGFEASALESLDRASTKVVAHLPPPWQRTFDGRGLVLGYVQSGKTSNFTAVIAKAADAGYRLFIVLSGIHNNLRRQTQARLDRQLVNLNKGLWIRLTSDTADFGDPGNADALLPLDTRRLLCVVKKNKSRLVNLISWLEGATEASRANCPVLVIDDEADQASINTGDEEKRSQINALIVRLLRHPRVAYVGYTATPFANVFIDPSIPDLYPKDFIIDLPRPADYFGPERIFGRERLLHDDEDEFDGLDVVRTVPETEVAALQAPRNKAKREGFEPEVTAGLAEAIRYFLLATAARGVRGDGGRHSSMLIHTTQYADVHEAFKAPVIEELTALQAGVTRGAAAVLAELRSLWDREAASVPADELGEVAVSFDELMVHLPEVVARTRVVVDNYRSTERLDYGPAPQTVIVVGGNTLSRGLTLEGLVVSFFLRTASAYDTLLQMGRWFGYRRGYSDLPRIWMPGELQEYFEFLATVEHEIRYDVERYEKENKTPLELAMRIRTHPKLAITSKLKMQAATPLKVSYSDRRLQTILFNHRDRDWLTENLGAARGLVGASAAAVGEAEDLQRGRWLFTGVPVTAVLDFLTSYRFHPDSVDLRGDLIRRYIAEQNGYEDLANWNVAVMGLGNKGRGQLDLGLPAPVGLMSRARLHTPGRAHANIKTLMSKVDRVVDLDIAVDEDMDDKALQALRPPGIGLLLLYAIDKVSEPVNVGAKRGRKRVRLDAEEHVIGVGLVFPRARFHDSEIDYMSVDLSDLEREELDLDPDELDVEGSLNEVV